MSDKENRFVLEQLWTMGLLHQTVWLGMYFNQDSTSHFHCPFPPLQMFSPLFQFIFNKLRPPLSDNSMVWVDGSPVDYNNWPNKSPDPKLLSADACITTRGVDGAWHLSQCAEQLGFVCKTTTGKLTHGFDFVFAEVLKWSFIRCDSYMVRPWSNMAFTENTVLNVMPQPVA